jgi:hypothetical protein
LRAVSSDIFVDLTEDEGALFVVISAIAYCWACVVHCECSVSFVEYA